MREIRGDKPYNASRLMKTRPISSAIIALLLLCGSAHAQTSQSAQKVFDSMIEALGGKAFLDVKEIQTSGRNFKFRRNEVVSSDIFTDFIKFPEMERTEFGKEKDRVVQINNGNRGWKITPPAKGKIPDVQEQSIPEEESFIDEFKAEFDYMVRFMVNAPKATLVNAGSDLVEYKRVDVLELRDPSKNLMRIFIDRETHLPVKTHFRRADESSVIERQYANWHQFDGVMTPLMVIFYKDGVKIEERRFDKVMYNPGFPDSLFAPPATPSK